MLTAFLVQVFSFEEQIFAPGIDLRMPEIW